MSLNEMNVDQLRDFLVGGCAFLCENKEKVNALNVFPVPDGDTGTNMSLTMTSAVKDLASKNTVEKVMSALSNGALMGARGNSGVILSQIFRGFASGLEGETIITAKSLSNALQKGVDLAYKSVMKPVEGTILTVSRAVAKGAVAAAEESDDILHVLEQAIEEGSVALANTPNQLPVLKEAGVVDAGGQGYLLILHGGLKALQGEDFSDFAVLSGGAMVNPAVKKEEKEIVYGYCTEVLIKGHKLPVDLIRTYLSRQDGDCLLVVGSEDLVKVHFHTNKPYKVLEYGLKYGTLHDIKIENMRDQHSELTDDFFKIEEEPKEVPAPAGPTVACGVVAIANGDGLAELFTSLGAAEVICGGQTMNPSAEDLLNAIDRVNAEEIVILPNNSNIILTAEQAKKLAKKPVHVLPTKFITQGIGAMLGFNAETTGAENAATMADCMAEIKSGEVTFAVRNSTFEGKEITAGDILGLKEGNIVTVGQETQAVLGDLLQEMVTEDSTLISFYYGNDLTEAEAMSLIEAVTADYGHMDIEVHCGGQPLYYFLVSVE
ncbi:MAG: DAK2 domain-containing protein [Peptococcaceae bacterium]|nr:DAK2 domain-containing protein [Peptococcaceae bacterium]